MQRLAALCPRILGVWASIQTRWAIWLSLPLKFYLSPPRSSLYRVK